MVEIDPETITTSVLYVSATIAIYPVSKYFLKPIIDSLIGTNEQEVKAHTEKYIATVNARKELTNKLAEQNMNPDDISKILHDSFPLNIE